MLRREDEASEHPFLYSPNFAGPKRQTLARVAVPASSAVPERGAGILAAAVSMSRSAAAPPATGRERGMTVLVVVVWRRAVHGGDRVENVRAEQVPASTADESHYVAESCCFIAVSCAAAAEVGVCDAPSVSCWVAVLLRFLRAAAFLAAFFSSAVVAVAPAAALAVF